MQMFIEKTESMVTDELGQQAPKNLQQEIRAQINEVSRISYDGINTCSLKVKSDSHETCTHISSRYNKSEEDDEGSEHGDTKDY
ncbi:hypothetical protein Trydic_g14608 [Trypoxylus dichotomus]